MRAAGIDMLRQEEEEEEQPDDPAEEEEEEWTRRHGREIGLGSRAYPKLVRVRKAPGPPCW